MTITRRNLIPAVVATAAAEAAAATYDVAVVGAGVFGSWTAYSLASSGARVLLIDQYGPASARASSGGESRIIRMAYGPDELYTRFSARSLGLWQAFFARINRPDLFQKSGVLWIGAPDHPAIRDSRAVLRKLNIRFEEFDAAGLARRYPQLDPPAGARAILEPDSGGLLARQAVRAVAAAAISAGAAYVQEAVQPPQTPTIDRLQTLGGQQFRAGKFVFACGPWLGQVFPSILAPRIFPTRQAVFFFGPPPGDGRFAVPHLPCWIDETNPAMPYGFPDLEFRGCKFAWDRHGDPFPPDSSERLVTPAEVKAMREYVAVRFPTLRNAPLVESRVCQYENTSSGDFLIDTHPDTPHVWFVGGGSGHGFKHGPAVGDYVAGRILRNTPAEPRFSLASKATRQNRSVY